MTIRFHSTTLADGRELIYVDDADTTLPAGRRLDERNIDHRPDTPQMRRDPLTGEWVSVVPVRQHRVVLPGEDQNPLAPQTPTNPSEIPDMYDVAVFENRSPSFGPEVDAVNLPAGLGFGHLATAVGRCEVVCFSPDSSGSLGSQRVTRIRTVIEAWAGRTLALSALDAVEQVFVFENRGEAVGVTLPHPHGQIYAYPFITPKTTKLVECVTEYGDSFFADLLAFEQSQPRVVFSGEHFSAYVPFAARWPLEVHLLPHRHTPDLAGLTRPERDELATALKTILMGLDALYDTPTPYIAAWHQAPVRRHRDTIRLMLQITSPRRGENALKYPAGSEAAMGAFIGDIAPETQAEALRQAISSLGPL